MGVEADCVRVVEETTKTLGGLDIIISNAVSVLLSVYARWVCYEVHGQQTKQTSPRTSKRHPMQYIPRC